MGHSSQRPEAEGLEPAPGQVLRVLTALLLGGGYCYSFHTRGNRDSEGEKDWPPVM